MNRRRFIRSAAAAGLLLPLIAHSTLVNMGSRLFVVASDPQTGLEFPSNNVSGSDVRIVFGGGNLLSRTSHSAIAKVRYTQQNGYYALFWHCWHDGAFHFDKYEYGCHPYPTTGTLDGTGQSTGGTSDAGAVHYYEIAGLGEAPSILFGHDYIASPGGSPMIVTKDTWVTHFRKCEIVGGTTLRHTFYPDIVNAPSFSIVQDIPLASLNTPGSEIFGIGASPWTSSNFAGVGSGYTNSETTSGVVRCIKLFNAPLSLADAQAEAASGLNSPVTSAGIASVWYMNQNPTPTDITDKSGAGHNPSWANANRPAVWNA